MLQWQHPEYNLPLYYAPVLLNLDVEHLIGRLLKYRIQFDYHEGHFVHKKLDYVTTNNGYYVKVFLKVFYSPQSFVFTILQIHLQKKKKIPSNKSIGNKKTKTFSTSSQ